MRGAAWSREPHHRGVILGRRLEGAGGRVPFCGVRGRPPGHDVDAVVDALPLVAHSEEQLVALDGAADVEAELRAVVVRDHKGRVCGQFLALRQVERLEGVGLAVAEQGAVEFVRPTLRHGADDEGRPARVLGVVRVQVDAKLTHRFLRQG